MAGTTLERLPERLTGELAACKSTIKEPKGRKGSDLLLLNKSFDRDIFPTFFSPACEPCTWIHRNSRVLLPNHRRRPRERGSSGAVNVGRQPQASILRLLGTGGPMLRSFGVSCKFWKMRRRVCVWKVGRSWIMIAALGDHDILEMAVVMRKQGREGRLI